MLAAAFIARGVPPDARARLASTQHENPDKDLAKHRGKGPIITDPILIWDLAADAPGAKNLRLSGDLKLRENSNRYDLIGLDSLRASGSSTFSTRGLSGVLKRIADATGEARPDVTVFDLRQEFHAFFDGVPVSWFGMHDWSNKSKTHQQVVDEEKTLLNSTPNFVRIAGEADVKRCGDEAPRKKVVVSKAQREQEIVEKANARYV